MKFRTPETTFGVRFSKLAKVTVPGPGKGLVLQKIHKNFTLAHSLFVKL
jgi:hypothetical protein